MLERKVTRSRRAKSPATVAPKRSKLKRRQQKRSIDTRLSILKAALSEFAEVGFDAASTRSIGERAAVNFPLITYHFRTKEKLWRAVAEHAFGEIRTLWDREVPADVAPRERVRAEFRIFLRFTIEYPDFHHFMMQESRRDNPRLPWLVETFLHPVMDRVLPQIKSAQKDGQMPASNPVLVYYMLIGMVSVLSSLGAEMRATARLDASDPKVVEAYWALIERTVFAM
jgi:TetR/AcrR family transcriptional regulator